MTAQFSDQFLYAGRDYSIAGISGEGLFNPCQYGLSPHGTCTACWKGYLTTYALHGDQLVLHALDINIEIIKRKFPWSSKTPVLHGKKPSGEGRYSSFFDYHFENVGLIIPYTGGMLIGGEFIWDLYVHMGYHPAWKYEEVYELIFDKGLLTDNRNISDKMREYRIMQKNEHLGQEPGKPFDYDSWIEKCFSLKY